MCQSGSCDANRVVTRHGAARRGIAQHTRLGAPDNQPDLRFSAKEEGSAKPVLDGHDTEA